MADNIQENIVALQDFLLDIECLDPLIKWTQKLNIFDILKISRAEIRHSNMLSWLLNPNENHGLGDKVIRGFIHYAVSEYKKSKDVFNILMMDFDDFIIRREWNNIDIFAVSNEEKFVLSIENKIGSGEHSNQLSRYRDIVEKAYPSYNKIFLYLSPEGVDASESSHWHSIGYQEVLEIIENSCKNIKLSIDAKILIDNYMETIRREIVGDARLEKICTEIYAKHQKALDLIFENKPDKALDIASVFRSWATEKTDESELELVLDKSNKTYTRFKTRTMSEILPDAEDAISGWGTKNHYFYEIYNKSGEEFSINLALSSKNMPENLRNTCEQINQHYPSRTQNINWQWRIPFRTSKKMIDNEIDNEMIFLELDKMLLEIRDFEDQLRLDLKEQI